MCSSAATTPPVSGNEEISEVKPPIRKRVISGVQPTGNLHLGNYLGAIRQWVENQDEHENFFFVVDLHAITAPHDPVELNKATYDIAALYLAAGLDPSKSRIFVQSHVPAHSELCWLLNCCTPMGWMEKMIQYKEKAKKQGESVSIGLFDYPILMAADILIYQAHLVPVGAPRSLSRQLSEPYCFVSKVHAADGYSCALGLSSPGLQENQDFRIPCAQPPPPPATAMNSNNNNINSTSRRRRRRRNRGHSAATVAGGGGVV